MNLYEKYLLPHLTHLACGLKPIAKQREKIVPRAEGKVLEIGIGSGLNMEYYDPDRVQHLWGLDPSAQLQSRIEEEAADKPFSFTFLKGQAERIPLQDQQADTILITYTLCTIEDTQKAMAEMHRVLKPGGKLLFCEHGTAPEKSVRWWQDTITPVWKHLAGGCHLNRDIPRLLEQNGFTITRLQTMYIPGWKPACFNYWGEAKPVG